MAKIKKIAVCNLKGGVGKTMLSTQLAHFLTAHGKKVLFVDTDYQGNGTSQLMPKEMVAKLASPMDISSLDCTKAYQLYSEETGAIKPLQVQENLFLIPAAVADEGLVRCSFKELLAAKNVKANIQKVENDFDFIIFDCPPSLGTACAGPLLASERVLVPLVVGANFSETLMAFKQAFRGLVNVDPYLEILAYVINRIPRDSETDKNLYPKIRASLGREALENPVWERISLRRAGQLRRPFFAMNSPTLNDEMTAVFDEILFRIGYEPLGKVSVTAEEEQQ